MNINFLKIKLKNKFIFVTGLIVVITNLFLPLSVLFLLGGDKPFENISHIATSLSLIVSVVGTYFLIQNFIIQHKFYKEDSIEKQFQNRCKAIDAGLSNLTNVDGTKTGAHMLFEVSKLKVNGSITFKKAIEVLNIRAIHNIASALFEFMKWISRDPAHYEYYVFYRVQFYIILDALFKLLDEVDLGLSTIEILKKYNSDNEIHMFIVSARELHSLELDLYVKFSELEEERMKTGNV